jgi:hypothetical protein
MWSAGLSCGGIISFAASRSRRSRGHRIDRNPVRRAQMSRGATGARPCRRSSIRSRTRIRHLLADEPALTDVRIRELTAPLGFTGSNTTVDDYLRDVRPPFQTKRTFCVTPPVGTPSTATS